jgi:hypothetical protein
MTGHTKYPLRCSSVAQVFDLSLAIPAPEACRAKCQVSGEYGEIFNLVPAGVAAVCAVIANKRSVAQEQEVGVGVKGGVARIASKTVEMPSISGCERISKSGS